MGAIISVCNYYGCNYVGAIMNGCNHVWVQSCLGAIIFGCNYFRCNLVCVQSYVGAINMGIIMSG